MQTTDSNSFEMNFNQPSNYYEVLELAPDATPEQIREAYHRIKATYRKDSVALYSLMDAEDTTALLEKVEEAYQTLSNPERRKSYDVNYSTPAATPAPAHAQAKIVSIDRVPPMESGFTVNDLLVPPSTDFEMNGLPSAPTTSAKEDYDPFVTVETKAPPETKKTQNENTGSIIRPTAVAHAIDQEIATETEFSGAFIRKVREARGVTIDEIMDYTKLSKRYITAIEEETYDRLPAGVFIRGFVSQLARYLKLPNEKVVQAYMDRYQRARPKGD